MHFDEKHVFNWVSQSELVSKNLENRCLDYEATNFAMGLGNKMKTAPVFPMLRLLLFSQS